MAVLVRVLVVVREKVLSLGVTVATEVEVAKLAKLTRSVEELVDDEVELDVDVMRNEDAELEDELIIVLDEEPELVLELEDLVLDELLLRGGFVLGEEVGLVDEEIILVVEEDVELNDGLGFDDESVNDDEVRLLDEEVRRDEGLVLEEEVELEEEIELEEEPGIKEEIGFEEAVVVE
ncbi:MAG: hypothetical protein Q9182_000274 [Xanthomendoza sp. 2 TL-2023]